jgi:hypothetical protein
MRIYFAAAMTNPARDLPTLAAIVKHLEAAGHAVPTRHVADPRGRELDAGLTDQELAQRDLGWLAGSDAFVAEVSAPSHGVGIEAMAAAQRLLPMLLLHRRGCTVSRLLLGLPFVTVASYGDVAEACSRIDGFLAAVGAASVARATG